MKKEQHVMARGRGRGLVGLTIAAATALGLVIGIAGPAAAVNISFGYADCRAPSQNGVGTSSYGQYSVTHYFDTNGGVFNKSWANGPGYVTNKNRWEYDQQFNGYAEGTYVDSATTFCW